MATNATSPSENQSAQNGNARLGLTKRQRDALEFITSYRSAYGYSPSFKDIQGGIGLASKSGVHRLVEALEQRGHIVRGRGLVRSIVILGETP